MTFLRTKVKILVFQVLATAHADKLSVHHDGESGAQSVTFCHAARKRQRTWYVEYRFPGILGQSVLRWESLFGRSKTHIEYECMSMNRCTKSQSIGAADEQTESNDAWLMNDGCNSVHN